MRWIRRLFTVLRVALVAALVLVTSLGAALPAVARVLGGPPPHVCHCEVRGGHATCACPRCRPELRDEHDDEPATDAVRASCGDDEEAVFGKALLAIAPSSAHAPGGRPTADEPAPLPPAGLRARPAEAPESPPPEA